MNDTDTSDEAFQQWFDEAPIFTRDQLTTWQECRRRSEAKAETLKQEWQALLKSEHEIIQKLEAQMEAERELISAMKENYMSLKAQIEERERKAWEACWEAARKWYREGSRLYNAAAYFAFKDGK